MSVRWTGVARNPAAWRYRRQVNLPWPARSSPEQKLVARMRKPWCRFNNVVLPAEESCRIKFVWIDKVGGIPHHRSLSNNDHVSLWNVWIATKSYIWTNHFPIHGTCPSVRKRRDDHRECGRLVSEITHRYVGGLNGLTLSESCPSEVYPLDLYHRDFCLVALQLPYGEGPSPCCIYTCCTA